MDVLSAMNGSGASGGGQKLPVEYSAQLKSPLINGESALTITEDSLMVTALFDAAEIPYADMNELSIADYAVTVTTGSGRYVFSRMGQWAQPFRDALYEAYNRAVLRALFTEGEALITTAGEYRCVEEETETNGRADIRVYENCVCILPPDLRARRIPLCFVTALEKGSFSLTLRIHDESYTFSKLGYDTVPFSDAVEKQIRALRERTLAAVRVLDPVLTAAQASQIAKLMPDGAAAPIGVLAGIAPTFIKSAEEKISHSRAAESYKLFKTLCAPSEIRLGFLKEPAISAETENSGTPEGVTPDHYIYWIVVPSADKTACAVEFAIPEGDSAATFAYRFDCGFGAFAARLNRAMESVGFMREVVSMPDEDLKSAENRRYAMAVRRTPPLRYIRASFAGRVIHTSPEAWKNGLLRHFNER